MRSLLLLLALSFGLAVAPSTARAADRVALVIGNGKYVNAGALPNPANDAQAVARALGEIGFDVAQGTDLDRNAMERLLRDFLRKAVAARVALLFYAGHGMQVDGRNYLVPVDAKLEAASDLGFETVELDKILASLDDPSRATIVILDACRDNPLARSFSMRLGATRSTAVGAGLAAYSTLGTGTLIAFATAPGQVALDGQAANSPFTQGLVKHLRTPGLEVRQMLTRVRADVAASTRNRQIPWDNSSLLGEVYLADQPKDQAQMAAIGVAPSPAPLPPLVQPAPSTPTPPSDPEAGTRRDYELASRIGNAEALQIFVTRHPAGYYADLARNQLAKLTKPEPAAEPVQGDMKIPVEFAGRSFTISATEIRDLVPGALGAPRLQRQVSIEIDPIGRFKGNNRGLRPDGTQTMNVFFTGHLNEGGPRSWKIEDGRLMGQSLVPGFHWSATVRPTAKGCAAEMAYKLPPG